MNIGSFMFSIAKTLMNWGQKLYDLWNMTLPISWVKDILKFFGANVNLPNEIGLNWIFTTAGASLILGIILYRIFK